MLFSQTKDPLKYIVCDTQIHSIKQQSLQEALDIIPQPSQQDAQGKEELILEEINGLAFV